MHWNCSRIALKLLRNRPKNCSKIALKLLLKCTETALSSVTKMDVTSDFRQQRWAIDSIQIALEMHCNCSEIAPKLHWNCTENALKLLWNCSVAGNQDGRHGGLPTAAMSNWFDSNSWWLQVTAKVMEMISLNIRNYHRPNDRGATHRNPATLSRNPTTKESPEFRIITKH